MADTLSNVIRARLSSPLEVLKQHDFRLLWTGAFCSLLGDQFYWIALPWLILRLTNDPLMMGSLVAVQMIPRSMFMLIGGALTDRFSPSRVMLISIGLRLILVGTLTVLVLSGSTRMGYLYLLALLFGTVDGFYFPAQNSIVPSLLNVEDLPAGNSLIQGTSMLSMFLGPLVAGSLIAWFEGPVMSARMGLPENSLQGIGMAFGMDAIGYCISLIMLWRLNRKIQSWPVGTATPVKQDEEDFLDGTVALEEKERVLDSIREGLHYAWKNIDLRVFFIIVAVMAFVVNGAITIGVPVLAKTRFPEGAAAYGLIVSSFGGGSLLGIILVSVLPAPKSKWAFRILLIVTCAMGVGLMLMSIVTLTGVAALIALLAGVGGGYILVMVVTWLQKRAPQTMLGRVMSLLTFATLGLNPFAMALAGALSKLSVSDLLFGSGALLSSIALITALSPLGHLMER
jgi:MFS family permease